MLKFYIQRLVLLINHIPLIKFIPRAVYYLALSQLKKLCGQHEIIRTVYIRNSFAQGTWIPGKSDIDLTVVLKSGLPIDKEWMFFQHFKCDYFRLQKIFPMLGEIEYISESNVKARCLYGYSGYQTSEWKLVYGEKLALGIYQGDTDKLRLDRLWQLISTYVHLFCPNFRVRSRNQKDLWGLSRLIVKTIKLSQLQFPEIKTTFQVSSEAQIAMINILDTTIKSNLGKIILSLANETFSNQNNENFYYGTRKVSIPLELQQDLLTIVQSKEYTYIIVKDSILEKNYPIKNFIETFDFFHKHSILIFFTTSLFQFYFSYCVPFKFITMLEDKEVIFSKPTFHALCQSVLSFSEQHCCNLYDLVCNNAVYMFSDLYEPYWLNLSEQDYKNRLYNWYLKFLLFLETSKLITGYELIEKHCSEIDSELGCLLQSPFSLKRFEILHKICQKIARKLNQSTKQKPQIFLHDIVTL